jgi:hypothetical protein
LLLHYKYKSTTSNAEMLQLRTKFYEQFWAIIWCCYRRNFTPLLANDQEGLKKSFEVKQPNRVVKFGFTTDSGWGCTIRVT